MEILWYFCRPALVSFLLQYFIGNRTKHKIWRHIPLYFFLLTLIFAIVASKADPGFVIGGNIMAAFIWIIIAICVLLGYTLAILARKIRK